MKKVLIIATALVALAAPAKADPVCQDIARQIAITNQMIQYEMVQMDIAVETAKVDAELAMKMLEATKKRVDLDGAKLSALKANAAKLNCK